MFKHYERAKDGNGEYVKFGNQEIDTAKSGMNYNLAPDRDSQGDFVRQRCAEARMQNRKDVNVMCSWVVTVPRDLSAQDYKAFFRASYDFLQQRYGSENVVSAYVHMDETTPHMHYAFVPVVEDKKRGGYKVSAKEAVDRMDLQTFHRDLDAHMTSVFGRDIGVANEATREGNRSIEELKRGTAQAELRNTVLKTQELLNKAKSLQKAIQPLEDEIGRLQGQLDGTRLKLDEILRIQPQKALTGSIKGVTVEDVDNLKKTAIVAVKATGDVIRLSQENERLRNRVYGLEKQIPSMMDKARDAKERTRLLELEKAFKRLPEDIQRQLLSAKLERSQWQQRDGR